MVNLRWWWWWWWRRKKHQWLSGGKDLLEVFPWPGWELTTISDVFETLPLQPHASFYWTRAVMDCLNEASCDLDIKWHEMTTPQECSNTSPKASQIDGIFYQFFVLSSKIAMKDRENPWNGRVGSCPKSQSEHYVPCGARKKNHLPHPKTAVGSLEATIPTNAVQQNCNMHFLQFSDCYIL